MQTYIVAQNQQKDTAGNVARYAIVDYKYAVFSRMPNYFVIVNLLYCICIVFIALPTYTAHTRVQYQHIWQTNVSITTQNNNSDAYRYMGKKKP